MSKEGAVLGDRRAPTDPAISRRDRLMPKHKVVMCGDRQSQPRPFHSSEHAARLGHLAGSYIG